MYLSTKTYGHEVGLSACFRQWRAESHCHLLHGYALAVKFIFESEHLDDRNWVVDFGDLKELKAFLQENFDHKMLVAADDPQLHVFEQLEKLGVAEVVVVSAVGCEAFAEMVYMEGWRWLASKGLATRVRLRSVEVREHGANSAIYEGETA